MTTKPAYYKHTKTADSAYGGFGYDSYQASAPKRLGLRWFVEDNRLILLGESGNEMGEVAMTETTINKALTYYFFIGVRSKGSAVKESVRKVGIRLGVTG